MGIFVQRELQSSRRRRTAAASLDVIASLANPRRRALCSGLISHRVAADEHVSRGLGMPSSPSHVRHTVILRFPASFFRLEVGRRRGTMRNYRRVRLGAAL